VTGGREIKDSRCSGRGGLAKERSRRKLEMWRNFGSEGFEFHGEKLAESAGDSELAHSPFMATREGEGEGSEA